MQTTIVSIIQDYGKKINRSLSRLDIISLFITVFFFVMLALYSNDKERSLVNKVVILKGAIAEETIQASPIHDRRPFGSKTGTTYTYSWCSGSSRILPKNKVYFSSDDEAQKSGRTLSKLCKK